MSKLIEEGFKKCEFLLKFETKESVISVDPTGIIPQKISTWTNWDVQFAQNAKSNKTTVDEELEQRNKAERIQTELFEIITSKEANAKQLQDFTEMGLIKGLRRLAGMVMINTTFKQNSGNIFYDSAHILIASLRGNKSKLCHYLDGVPGCGARTESEIRKQFFNTIELVKEMLVVE